MTSDTTLQDWLEQIQHTDGPPAAVSVAALAAASAAALAAKISRILARRLDSEAQELARTRTHELSDLAQRLLQAAFRDMKTYHRWRMDRQPEVSRAMVEEPLEIARWCATAEEHCDEMLEFCPPMLAADVRAARELLSTSALICRQISEVNRPRRHVSNDEG